MAREASAIRGAPLRGAFDERTRLHPANGSRFARGLRPCAQQRPASGHVRVSSTSMMRSLVMATAALALALLSARWAPHTPGGVVTLADYFELGEERVERALDSDGTGELAIQRSVAERWEQAVVRVRVHYDFRDTNQHSTRHATGALVFGGRYVATVAHELDGLIDRADARVEVLLGDGTALVGRIHGIPHYASDRGDSDWALVEVLDAQRSLPSLEFGDSEAGPRLVLGFPGRYGRGGAGRVVLDDAGAHLPLRPLRILGSTAPERGEELVLTAGCIPIQGISGAPVIDARGRLVAIQRAVTDQVTAGKVDTWLNVVPVGPLRKELERLAK